MNEIYKEYVYRSVDQCLSHSYILPCLLKFLGDAPGTILDLGCGNGSIARALIAKGYDVYGLDASVSGIAAANAESPGRFFVLDVSSGELQPELAAKRFDTVISTEVIEHLYSPREFLSFARRILTKKGQLIISTPYHGYIKNLALAVTGKLDAHFTVLWDGGHIKFFSRKTLEAILHEQGFEAISFAGAGRLPFLWKSMVIKSCVI